jgi:hypothetical protein
MVFQKRGLKRMASAATGREVSGEVEWVWW